MGPSSIFGILAFVVIGYTVGSVRIIKQGNEALVERLGRYQRKLRPGLNFVIPVLDSIVLEDTVREQILDTEPQSAITTDNVP
ncbi:MAG: SPFH domain-containing protein, partial [Cyanobacteria bacterium J06659_2]